ncbi:hypothetical protein [Actinoplanes sp. NPDC051411]|uniref:hypothetical protein n=1 Tax=Actinoplanes sp. NPDC051411 TaxID=3155522 RepID=UPI003415F287
MPAVLEATRNLADRAVRPETPARLRLWTALVVIVAVALFAATSVLMAQTQRQVRIIGDDAAPRAATASDLYFGLSDLDAQVARLVLSGDDDSLAATQIDALATYRDRSTQIDADLQQLLGASSDRATSLALLDDLAVYRERVWQALATTGDKHGFYTQATNVLHLRLLPGAQTLREASQERLDRAYAQKQTTQRWGIAVALGLGAVLLVMLLAMQVWMARRFRRTFNPALLIATILTIALAGPAAIVFALQGQKLGDAREQSLTPYLALSQARAVSYDAAADTSRYLISGGLAYYKQDFAAKSACLTKGGACGPGGETIIGALPPGPALDRWAAYQRDNDKIIGLADAGKRNDAVAALTGIRRGDAAFDFSYFDDAVDQIATARKAAFDDSLHSTRTLLTGWTEIPLGVAVLVLVLVPLGVRRRFAEYR